MVFHFSNYHPGEETTQKELNYGYVTSNVATEREAYKVDPMYISGSPVAGRHQIGTVLVKQCWPRQRHQTRLQWQANIRPLDYTTSVLSSTLKIVRASTCVR